MPQPLLCLRNVVSGGTVAEIVGDSSWTAMEAALAVVASTGHNNFKLVKGNRCFFPGSATTLGEFAGEGETAELEILIQDFPILRISGIPDDATFGGHGPAIGSTTASSSLHDLNGDWSAVPLLQVRGHPVWTKQTRLRNPALLEELRRSRHDRDIQGTVIYVIYKIFVLRPYEP